jgi:hypothetical protein
MAVSIEDRVASLEREFNIMKAKVDAVDADAQTIPSLINTQFRLVDSQFARVRAEIADLKSFSEDRFNAVLRALAETLAEGKREG